MATSCIDTLFECPGCGRLALVTGSCTAAQCRRCHGGMRLRNAIRWPSGPSVPPQRPRRQRHG
jgi:hypothetical protein